MIPTFCEYELNLGDNEMSSSKKPVANRNTMGTRSTNE